MDPKMSSYEHFTLTRPGEYIAVVEINRAGKLNAFIESYVKPRSCSLISPSPLSLSIFGPWIGKSIMEALTGFVAQNVARSG